MKEAKQATWYLVLVIVCVHISCHESEQKCPNANSTLGKKPGIFDETLPAFNTTESEDCGNHVPKLRRAKRIVAGVDAGPGRFPWMAYIRCIGFKKCGGALVNRYHVVTAAHCFVGKPLNRMVVALGVYDTSDMSSTGSVQKFGVSQITAHPSYKDTSKADRFDVAVLRLNRSVDYTPNISPINLPGKDESFVGQTAWVAGWGAVNAKVTVPIPVSKRLQAVELPVTSNADCEEWHLLRGIDIKIYDEMMCAGHREGGEGVCKGDSGGPLMVKKNDGWYLIGIVSFSYSCALPDQPGGFHNVAKTVDWMKGVIGCNNDDACENVTSTMR